MTNSSPKEEDGGGDDDDEEALNLKNFEESIVSLCSFIVNDVVPRYIYCRDFYKRVFRSES